MDKDQRRRHTAKPGLSGLAQVNGRNNITWEKKLEWDQKYIKKVSFAEDARIVGETIKKAIIKQEDITEGDMATAADFGDYLLKNGKVDKSTYDEKQEEAKEILNKEETPQRELDDDLVSIIMPSYNTTSFIENSIQSVLDQSYENWELIIVDDCSTDNTDEVLAPFLKDSRIKYLKNEKNSGAAVSRNRALREAKGRWIAFLDSDDLWYPDKLEKQLKFMKKNGYHFSYTNYEEIITDGKPNGVKVTGPKHINERKMFDYCWPGCLTVMYDQKVVGLIQIADIKKNNDYAMWLKVIQKADCYLLPEILAQYRRGRKGSVSTHSIATLIRWHYKLFKDAEEMPILESVINTCRNMVFGYYKKKRYVKEA